MRWRQAASESRRKDPGDIQEQVYAQSGLMPLCAEFRLPFAASLLQGAPDAIRGCIPGEIHYGEPADPP
jgi:hypothetical protein